jgi:ubiquitin
MESTYDKVVKLTAEILKSWQSNPGVVSPFSSSSSSHNQPSDNHLEHYVQQNVTTTNEDISSMFNSDLFRNGGETMTTDKTLDVNSSATTDTAYNIAGTTEPDPQSAIAITKSAEIPTTTVGTTANTTEEAPSAGETTEPMTKAAHSCPTCGSDSCPDCNKTLTLCNCSGMSKADGPDAVTENTTEIEKAAESTETEADEAKETPEEEAKEQKEEKEEPIKKSSSLWNGAFAPVK